MDARDTYRICAIDGGGTGCRVAIADASGAVLADAAGGPANHATDPGEAREHLLETIGRAARALGLGDAETRRLVAHAGIAGVMDASQARALAAALPFERCAVTDDRVTTAVGALGGADGVLLSAGTGSFAALCRDGGIRFLGGWGFALGDQASGAWLGRALLREAMLAHDGLAAETDLTRWARAEAGGSAAALVAFAGTARPPDWAAFAPRIVAAAEAGDTVGRALMARGAAYLEAVLDAVEPAEGEVICLAGGIGPHYAAYLPEGFRARFRPPAGSALDGAIALALGKARS